MKFIVDKVHCLYGEKSRILSLSVKNFAFIVVFYKRVSYKELSYLYTVTIHTFLDKTFLDCLFFLSENTGAKDSFSSSRIFFGNDKNNFSLIVQQVICLEHKTKISFRQFVYLYTPLKFTKCLTYKRTIFHPVCE